MKNSRSKNSLMGKNNEEMSEPSSPRLPLSFKLERLWWEGETMDSLHIYSDASGQYHRKIVFMGEQHPLDGSSKKSKGNTGIILVDELVSKRSGDHFFSKIIEILGGVAIESSDKRIIISNHDERVSIDTGELRFSYFVKGGRHIDQRHQWLDEYALDNYGRELVKKYAEKY